MDVAVQTDYAVLVVGSNGDGAKRGLVTIVELTDPRPYNLQVTVYGNLIYTVIYMSDRLLTQANPNPRLPPPPDLRRTVPVASPSNAQACLLPLGVHTDIESDTQKAYTPVCGDVALPHTLALVCRFWN